MHTFYLCIAQNDYFHNLFCNQLHALVDLCGDLLCLSRGAFNVKAYRTTKHTLSERVSSAERSWAHTTRNTGWKVCHLALPIWRPYKQFPTGLILGVTIFFQCILQYFLLEYCHQIKCFSILMNVVCVHYWPHLETEREKILSKCSL